MKRLVYAIPVLLFLVLAFFLFKSLILPPPSILPSALINKPAPKVALAAVDEQTPPFSTADLASGHVTVVNFFASWCEPCHQEAGTLMALAKVPGVILYGVDYEEHQAGAGRGFLNEVGNPFSRLVADSDGKEGIEWGVDAAPETFVVDGKGIIRFKWVGPLDDATLAGELLPAIKKAELAS